MRLASIGALLCSIAIPLSAATPEGTTNASLPTFRVTTAEVHVTFTAVREKNEPATDIAQTDFTVLRDGSPLREIVSFSPYRQAPLSALVLTDVSDSMLPGLSLERAAAQWLQAESDSSRDHVSYIDFGDEVETPKPSKTFDRHLTSLYDALMETLARVPNEGPGRRALIVLTDGLDNYSLNSLEDVISAAQRSNIAIYAITAHPGKKQAYRPDLLGRLATQTGGKYFEVRKSNEMLSAITEINDELRNGYELVFRAASTSSGLHKLSVIPNKNHLRFRCRSAYFQPAATEEVATVR